MKVVLLAGGLGTRMREETEFKPKPMVEVGGMPILWHIMRRFASFGHKEFVICAGYRGDVIRRFFLDFRAMTTDFTLDLSGTPSIRFHSEFQEQDWKVTICDTGPVTPTGGRVYRVREHLNDEPFFCTYGDGLADVDLDAVKAFHDTHDGAATVTAVRPVSRFGTLEISDSNCVSQFQEKPVSEGWINAGFFLFEPDVFRYLHEDSTLEQEPMQQMAADSQLHAYKHSGFFQPMDTFREYTMLNEMWNRGDAPWKA